MSKMKKISSLLLALFMGTSLLALASCGGGSGKGNKNCSEHVYSEDFVCITEPTCTEVGKKAIACVNCGAIKGDKADIAARGHDYANTGACKRCNKKAAIPAADSSASYTNIISEFSGCTGTDYDRYELKTDTYYEVEIGRTKSVWVSVSVPEAGQYALYSIENNGVTAKRYDASAHYIPIDKDGNYIGHASGELSGGNFISTVNCGELYWSTEWRATFCLTGDAGSTAKIVIVRIDTPAWQPGYMHKDILATEIDGRAPNGPEGATPTVVPYETDYFFDEEVGFYRMGTPSNPGALIYVAITAIPERMLLDSTFAQIQYQGPNLNLDGGYNADGDHIVLHYAPFIMSDETYGGTSNSYELYVNDDGMYPVNQELFTFLNLYVYSNSPMDIPEEILNNPAKREHSAWLAACYYYDTLPLGSEANPYKVTDSQFTVTTIEYDYIFYSIRYTNETDSNAYVSFVDVICEDANALMVVGDKNYYGPFNVRIETNYNKGASVKFATQDGSAASFEVTLQDAQDGAVDYPIELNGGTETLNFTTIHMLDGSISYECYYYYTAKSTGTLTLSTDADIYMLANNATVDANASSTDGAESTSTDTYLTNGVATMDVTAGDVISIYLSNKTGASVSFSIEE